MPLRTVSQDVALDSEDDLGLEIDLYDELASFAEQPPEDRQSAVERIVVNAPTSDQGNQPEAAGGTQVEDDFAFDTELPTEDDFLGSVADDLSATPDIDAGIDIDGAPEPVAEIASTNETRVTSLDDEIGSVLDLADEPEELVLDVNQVVCADCGSVSSRDDLLCIACGAFLGEFGETATTPEPAPVAEAAPLTPVCADCGSEVTEEEVFCPSCGAVLN